MVQLQIVPSHSDQAELVAFASHDAASVYGWRDGSLKVLHNSVMQKITAMDANQQSLAVGVYSHFGSSKVGISCKIMKKNVHVPP